MDDKGQKSFWDRPEGTTGMIFGFGALGAALWAVFTYIVPWLITAALSGIVLLILGLVLAFMVALIANGTTWAMYQVAMRWITGFIIELDPIGIMRGYVKDLKERLVVLIERTATVAGEKRSLKNKIDENEKNAKLALQMASKAKDAHNQGQFVLKARKAGLLTESNRDLSELYGVLERTHSYLIKARESTEFMIEDLQTRIEVKGERRKAIRSAYSAVSAAQSVIRGDMNKRALFEQALEVEAADYGMKLGKMEEFIDTSGNFLDSLDLRSGVYEEEALKQLETWEQQSDKLLFGEDNHLLLTHNPTEAFPVAEAKEAAYAELFKVKK